MVDKVFIEGLRVNAVIGVFEWERQITQPLVIDLELHCDTSKAAASDAIDDAVNYKAVADEVNELVIRLKSQLIERLADEIARHILQHYLSVVSLQVTVRKPMAVPNTSAVGVSIERDRDHLRTGTRL